MLIVSGLATLIGGGAPGSGYAFGRAWEPSDGRWAVALMNADGSSDVIAQVDLGAKAGFVVPLSITLTVVGVADSHPIVHG